MEKWLQMLRPYKWIAMAGLGVLVVGVTLFLLTPPADAEEEISLTDLAASEQVEELISPSQSDTSLVIDVKGAVKHPGIYELPSDSRVYDAVEIAGGLREDADSTSINLAKKVSDEEVVYVATHDEERSIIEASSTSTSSEGAKSNLINLNTATETDLQTISGIGAKRAADIIAYREQHGRFQSVDDLKQVSGIGDKSLEKIRPYVTVD